VSNQHRISETIHKVLDENRTIVNQFKFSVDIPKAHEKYGLWSIPIATGVVPNSVHDVLTAIRTLQRAIDESSDVPISLYLDITPPPAGLKSA
jgi:hypothetical protein